jgi:GNAT superfamily N-acetyltransferase
VGIRSAAPSDAAAISALLLGESRHITLDPTGLGAEPVLNAMRAPAIESNLVNAQFQYWVAEEDEALQGVLGLRDGKHLYQLFVPTPLHRHGIARRLWTHTLKQARLAEAATQITVRASPYGLTAYERLGFVPTGPRVEMNGVAFIPMAFPLSLTSSGAVA